MFSHLENSDIAPQQVEGLVLNLPQNQGMGQTWILQGSKQASDAEMQIISEEVHPSIHPCNCTPHAFPSLQCPPVPSSWVLRSSGQSGHRWEMQRSIVCAAAWERSHITTFSQLQGRSTASPTDHLEVWTMPTATWIVVRVGCFSTLPYKL